MIGYEKKSSVIKINQNQQTITNILSYLSITDASRFSQVSKENKPMRSDLAKFLDGALLIK